MIGSSLPALVEDVGAEIDDLTIAVDNDGDRQLTAVRVVTILNRIPVKLQRHLLNIGVHPYVFRQELSLTVDGSDSEKYPLPPRVERILLVMDDNEDPYALLTPEDFDGTGYIPEEGLRAIRLRNITPTGTVVVWAIQRPCEMSYGVCATFGASTLELAASPVVGRNGLVDDYYNNARVMIVDGNGKDQVATVSDFVASTRVLTLSAAWGTQPANDSKYAFMLDLPESCAEAVTLGAARQLARSAKYLIGEDGVNHTLNDIRRDEKIAIASVRQQLDEFDMSDLAGPRELR